MGVLLAASCAAKEESANNETASGEVTPQLGGTILAETGAGVQVPAGSVTETKSLQIAAEGSERIVAELPTNAGQPYAFTPHGTTFAKPVTITVPAVAGANQVLRLDNEQDTTWEVVEGATFANGVATFQSNHFCIYVTVPKNNTGSGGSSSTGGVSATTVATGGVVSGGASSIGSSGTVSGGTTAKGGASSTGGTTAKGGASSTGGTTAKGGASSTGGTTAKGGTSSTGGTTSTGGITAKGGEFSTGGTTSTGTSTSAVVTNFCTPSDLPATACYTNGMAACSTQVSACCADSGCSFGLTCTLKGMYGETKCISDGSAASKALYQTVKSCLVAAEAGCPLTATPM